MYIAALRIADDFGCATIGIQYQQGLKDLTPASDLVEGLLNNVERPPVYHETTAQNCTPGAALPHFNEVDECAGLDALITNGLWTRLGFSPETTLHDVRWGRWYKGNGINDFVWVLEISGSVPPAHLDRRVCRRHQRTPTGHVLPQRRRIDQGRQQARLGGVEPRLCGRRQTQLRSGSG